MSLDKTKICYIRAKLKDDYVFDGIKNSGYQILIPYKDKNIIWRCAREAWFRLKLPFRKIWFNSEIKKTNKEIYIIKDPLITAEFLNWVKTIHPKARVILDYDNRVSRSINPNDVDAELEKWTYDEDDAREYGMNLKHGAYLDVYRIRDIEKYPKDIDVLYLGRDKGRLNDILEFQNTFQKMGLTTKFHICADRSFLTYKNPAYKPLMPYREYLDLLKRSKAILNIFPGNQKSITQREYEAVFDNVKCITNNMGILDFELYSKDRFFVLGYDSLDSLKDFLETPISPISDEVLEAYTFDRSVEQLVSHA